MLFEIQNSPPLVLADGVSFILFFSQRIMLKLFNDRLNVTNTVPSENQ